MGELTEVIDDLLEHRTDLRLARCLASRGAGKVRMTQQELADKVSVSRQTIVAIEKGKYSPSLELAFRIARVFNTTLEEVFSYEP